MHVTELFLVFLKQFYVFVVFHIFHMQTCEFGGVRFGYKDMGYNCEMIFSLWNVSIITWAELLMERNQYFGLVF